MDVLNFIDTQLKATTNVTKSIKVTLITRALKVTSFPKRCNKISRFMQSFVATKENVVCIYLHFFKLVRGFDPVRTGFNLAKLIFRPTGREFHPMGRDS